MAKAVEKAREKSSPRNPSPHPQPDNEQKFRTIVETLPDAILVHRGDTIVFVNPFCVRLLHAEGPEQLLGKSIASIIHPDFLPVIRNRIQDCYSTGTASPPVESVLIGCDGVSVETEAVAIPIDWNGSPAIEVVLRDIRARKQAEQSAEQWQKRLKLAEKAGLRIGLWDWDLGANTLIWSDETYRQFGYEPNDFSGRVEDAVTRIHPEDRARVEQAIQKVISGGPEYSAQYRLLRPDGTLCWVDAHGVMVYEESAHMLGIGVDITSLKQTELSLQESEEKYRLLLNSTAEAIYGLDLQGKCTFCNPSCLRLLGYKTPEELLGQSMHAMVHHTREDGTPYALEECEIYIAFRKGMASHITGEVLWRADGTSFPSEYWSYPVYKAGELVGAVVTFLDISERRRAEQELRQSEGKYRKIFENAIYGIFRSKPDGTLLDVNSALVKMLGYDSREELLTRNLNTDIYEDPTVRQQIIERHWDELRVDGAEVTWKRKDGKNIFVRISGGAFSTTSGEVTHFEVIVEDITERRSLEEQFRQAHKMEAIGLLAGGISHDFNNSLSVILGNAELLLENPQSTVQHYAEEIKKATGRAAQLARQLLAFSRKQVLYPTVLDLNAVVLEVGTILQRLIGEDIRVVTNLEVGLDPIRADRSQIEQILMNLATNARDAMPDGGQFTIRTGNAELGPPEVSRHPYVKPGRYVRLSISDTGAGMSDEVRLHAFEPFFSTKPQGRGTGLGLATVYGVVKQSGGYIWLSSPPQQGATFDIYFPRVAQRAVRQIASLKVSGEFPRGTETILLLEDDDSLRLLVSEFLTASGYNVLPAGRGTHAVELSRQFTGSIPLIISDIVLPDVSGPVAVAKVQALHPEAKVLYVSGNAELPVTERLVAEGAILMQKPVSRKDLLSKVDDLLHPELSSGPTG